MTAAIPTDTTAWCQEVERVALLCLSAPSLDRTTRLRALLGNAPGEFLPSAWETLIAALHRYLDSVDRTIPRFDGRGLLDRAAAATPPPAPAVALPYVD